MGINNPNTPKKAFSVLLVFDQESANSKVSYETLTYMLRAMSDYCARLNEFISRHYPNDNITVSTSNGWPYNTYVANTHADISIGGFLLEDSVSTTKVTNIRINNVPLFTRQSSLYENLPHAKYTKELRHNFMLLRDQYPESIAHCKDRVNDFLDILEAYAFYIEIDRANVHDWSRSKFAKPKMNFGYPPGMIQPGFTDTDRERLSEFNPNYRDLRMKRRCAVGVNDIKLANRLELEIAILEDAYLKLNKFKSNYADFRTPHTQPEYTGPVYMPYSTPMPGTPKHNSNLDELSQPPVYAFCEKMATPKVANIPLKFPSFWSAENMVGALSHLSKSKSFTYLDYRDTNKETLETEAYRIEILENTIEGRPELTVVNVMLGNIAVFTQAYNHHNLCMPDGVALAFLANEASLMKHASVVEKDAVDKHDFVSEDIPLLHPQTSSVADKISVVILGYDGSFSSNALVELSDTLVKATQVKFELIPKNDSVRYTIRYDEIDAHATDTARSFTLTLFDYGVECKKKFFNLEKSSDTLVSFTSYIMGEFGKYLLELEGYFTNSISKLLVDLTIYCADGHTYNLRTQSVFSDDTIIVVLKRLTGKRLYTGMARIPAKADSLLEMIHDLKKSKQTIKLFKKH